MEYYFLPLYWDSTMLAELATCQLSFFRKYVQHLVPIRTGSENIHLVAGGAFAKASEVARKAKFDLGLTEVEARLAGLREIRKAYSETSLHSDWFKNKSFEAVCIAFIKYLRTFPLDSMIPVETTEGKAAIEFRMEVDLPINHPQLGVPLKFCGRADVITARKGELFCGDEKTCSSFPSNWETSWDLRGQFSAYTWLLREYGYETAGAIVRQVSLPKAVEKLKPELESFLMLFSNSEGYSEEYLQELIYYSDKLKYAENIEARECVTIRRPHQVKLWHSSMLQHITRFIEALKNYERDGINAFTAHFSEHCVKYTQQCAYADACLRYSEDFLDSYFKQEIWLPHEAKRVSLEDYLYANAFI